MSQAEELLAKVADAMIEHQHPVTDSDTYYIIDPITRKVENKASKKNTIMQRDHNSERLTFECPRYIEGHDMSLCNATKIHYVNIDKETDEERPGVYEVEDIALKPDDENAVVCTWLVSRNATRLVGDLEFWIQYACVIDGEVVYEWYTDVNDDISIKRTRNNGETVVEEYPDVLDQWKSDVYKELSTAVKSVNDITPDENGNVVLPEGVTDYNELLNKPIERIESLDQEHLVNFRDLESGQYILYGYFSPYENSDISLSADNSFVSVIRKTAGSHIICLDPLNAKIVFFEILVDENEEKGYTYTRTIIPLLDINNLLTEVGNIEDLTTDDKTNVVAAINELLKTINGIPAVQYTPQTLTEEQKEQARDNIGFTDVEAVALAAEMGLVDPITDENGAILTDENGAILTL